MLSSRKFRIWRRIGDAVLIACVIGTGWQAVTVPAIRASDQPIRRLLQPGMGVEWTGWDWSVRPYSVVLFMSPNCAACGDSRPFYRRLALAAQQANASFLVVSSRPETAVRSWLADAGISADFVLQLPQPSFFGLMITPTLVFFDGRGRVTGAMAARLTADEEERVIAHMKGDRQIPVLNYADTFAEEIDQITLTRRRSGAVLLDIRERNEYEDGHLDGARNIPRNELSVRAAIELPRDRPVLIDCARVSALNCRVAGLSLRTVGFPEVALVFPRLDGPFTSPPADGALQGRGPAR